MREHVLLFCLLGLVLTATIVLEPISKSPEEDNEAGELNKAQEILGMVLPADEDSALPLDPSEEALNEPTAHIAG
jgi:hypothetical protein